MHFKCERPAKSRSFSFKTLAQLTIQFRVARLPNFVPGLDAIKIDIATAKREPRFAGKMLLFSVDGVYAATFLLVLRSARIKDDAITRFHRREKFDHNPIAFEAQNLAEIHASFFAEARMYQL